MRIWSIHPKYLDSKGLVALWRETLLAQHVLAGKTKGYRNHPQLDRFKELRDPILGIGIYLRHIVTEARGRGYNFDDSKIIKPGGRSKLLLLVTTKQMAYEREHLLRKLETRDSGRYLIHKKIRSFDPHPLFGVVEGEIASWEIL